MKTNQTTPTKESVKVFSDKKHSTGEAVDWEKRSPEQVFEYLTRCGLEPTDFQKGILTKMIANAIRQTHSDLLREVEWEKPKFEYLVVNHTDWIFEEPDEMNGHWFQDRLDKYGLEGWELCAVDDIHVYFKKILSHIIKRVEGGTDAKV